MFPNSIILFQGEASDNDENGQAITAWEWRSDRDGVLGTQPIFTLTASSISTGTHVISLRVQDDEGDWSPTEQVTLQVMDAYSTYLPIVSK